MKRNILSLIFGLLVYQSLPAQPALPDNGPLYTDTVVPRIDITINPDTLDWIYKNPANDLEFHAKFVFNNGTVCDTIDPVGFRLRGNTSRYSKKKSFKVSFNTFTPGGKYYGVEKLNLNGEHNDPSVMRSKVMWDILRKWGIPAPRANHVELFINGRYYGLYINVEHIDEEFVFSRFGNKNGNLYKCLYPADLNYLGSDPDDYKLLSGDRRVYELTTNKEEDNYSDLAALTDVLENSPDNKLACELEELFNTYDYLKIIAADIFCGNWDGYIYNKNNYYLYHNTATGKMEYIPYDVDNTFGIDWFGVDWAALNIYAWHPGGTEKRPLYSRLINNPELRKQFTYYANQLITTTIDIDSLMLSIEDRKNMIAPFIAEDPFYPLDYGYDYNDFLLSCTKAIGAHVKWGLYPFFHARSMSMSQQIESGAMVPVIKYIRHRRDEDQKVMISACVETDIMPVSVILLYSINDGDIQQADMPYDGHGSYSATLGSVSGETKVSYQVMVTDGLGRMKLMPCAMAVAKPVSGYTPLLFINEFMADNSVTVSDEYGNYSDWIEIYNGDTGNIYLGDLYMTDNLASPDKWQLPGINLQPGGFALFWADGNPTLGDRHAEFKLDKEGEAIGLFTADLLLVDTLTFGMQSEDISYGRRSDGAAENRFFVYPNPVTGTMVKLSHRINCRVFNSSGLQIFAGKEVDEIDIRSYPPGLYIIVSDNGWSAKFIVY
ncbi:MAG TPA: CotH kinase family protein [Bacteroidales bacterium]|nr:CotH kinase family protein [Bacteroidales bacterium]